MTLATSPLRERDVLHADRRPDLLRERRLKHLREQQQQTCSQ
jgi:hypothetical protein